MPAMTSEEFGLQMKRLVSVYGPQAYPEERLKLIWTEVADFEQPWLAKEVDVLIGTCRQPPLVEAFAAAATSERERRWSKEREAEKVAAKKFMSGNLQLPDEDRAMMFTTIRARLNGNVSDGEWATFMGSLALLCGPIEPLWPAGHAALTHPRIRKATDLAPDELVRLGERQRRNLPYVDN